MVNPLTSFIQTVKKLSDTLLTSFKIIGEDLCRILPYMYIGMAATLGMRQSDHLYKLLYPAT